jgi:hypothetical protein
MAILLNDSLKDTLKSLDRFRPSVVTEIFFAATNYRRSLSPVIWGAYMSRDQELFEDEEKSWENVQSGHSGISPDNMDNGIVDGVSPDDDIIELVDVVREGESLPDTDADELSLLLDQEEGPQKEEDFLGREDEDLTEFSLPLDETAEQEHESGLTEREAFHARFESPDFDFEVPGSLDEPAAEEVTDISEEHLDEIPEEDLDEVMAGLMDEEEGEISEPVTQDEEPPSVSQERLETIITERVTDVVERVVRETVAEVAERVIKEAIESLKHSLESRPE